VDEKSKNTKTFEKIFFAVISSWLLGRPTNTKVQGSQEEVDALMAALLASKNFQDELNKPDASIESVTVKLGAKHLSASHFESVFGVSWPL